MKVFVTGASGHVASYLVPELLGAGHSVVGLARSDRAAETVRSLGAEVWPGDLDDLEGLSAAVQQADGAIHLAFKHDEQESGHLDAAVAADMRAITAMGRALVGTGKPLVGTSATAGFVLAGHRGELLERSTRPAGPRIDSENLVIGLADQGVRSSVVRLPPAVHGGGRFGFVSGLIDIAEATGMSGYVGDGSNRWPASHAHDVALVYRLALEIAEPGSRFHAVAEEGVLIRHIAEAIGRRLDLPVGQVREDDAARHFTYLRDFISLDNPVSSQATRRTMRWAPSRPAQIAALEPSGNRSAC
jgi:nucleoside-diphosphate-sugar epimerase